MAKRRVRVFVERGTHVVEAETVPEAIENVRAQLDYLAEQ
jgi:hypothetical protein